MQGLNYHGDTEARSKLLHENLTERVIGAAIEVHRSLGPGLLESTYEECLCHELPLQGIAFERQIALPVEYKGVKLDCGYRLDLIVENVLIIEIKCVEHVLPVHEAQLLTYLKMTGKRFRTDSELQFIRTDEGWNCQKGFVTPCLCVSVVNWISIGVTN